jgi:diguanylate cyclase (GGDEF)-like protein
LSISSSPADSRITSLVETQRRPQLFRLGFAAPLEHSYWLDQQLTDWPIRLAVASVFLGIAASLHWALVLAGGLQVEWKSPAGLVLYGLIVPMLGIVALVSAVKPLRRFSDAAVLTSIVVVSVLLAAVLILEQPRQPISLPPLACALYWLSALILFRIPAYRGLIAAAIALVGSIGILGWGRWSQPQVRSDLILILSLSIPSAFATLIGECAAKRLWLSELRLATSARLDYLTGLLNRRSFEAEAAELLRQSARTGSPSALLLLDIDFFKSVNDLYGHARGDQVLKGIAAVIGRAGRQPADLCARYGGEEFAVMWTDCTAVAARRSAETLLLEIRRLNIENRGSKVAEVVTASAGLIAWETDPVGDIQDGISQADHLLYMAKRSGRNRLVTLKSAQLET